MTAPSRVAPCVPHWLAAEREGALQINNVILKSIAFLGAPTSDHFAVDGTAFLVSITVDNYDFRYFVAARHVVWPIRIWGFDPQPPEAELSIRINQLNGQPKIISTNVRDWIFHDNLKGIDICAYPFSERDHNPDRSADIAFLDLQTISLARPGEDFAGFGIDHGTAIAPGKHFAQLRRVELGDEVFFPGAFISHIGRKKNLPIVRAGCVAAMPEEPVEFFSPVRPAYLIEARSVGGLSGSPIFLHLAPEQQRGDRAGLGNPTISSLLSNPNDIDFALPYLLLGMVLGHHMSSAYLNDFVPTDLDRKPLADADINSGISVALPVVEILNFLYLPKFVADRGAAIEERRKVVGYREQ
jgi:hypothetical protein